MSRFSGLIFGLAAAFVLLAVPLQSVQGQENAADSAVCEVKQSELSSSYIFYLDAVAVRSQAQIPLDRFEHLEHLIRDGVQSDLEDDLVDLTQSLRESSIPREYENLGLRVLRMCSRGLTGAFCTLAEMCLRATGSLTNCSIQDLSRAYIVPVFAQNALENEFTEDEIVAMVSDYHTAVIAEAEAAQALIEAQNELNHCLNQVAQPVSYCPNAPPSSLRIGSLVELQHGDTEVGIYAEPALSSPLLVSLPPDQMYFVTDGPTCADSLTWWQLSFTTGMVGWSPEGIQDQAFLRPVDLSSSEPRPQNPMVSFMLEHDTPTGIGARFNAQGNHILSRTGRWCISQQGSCFSEAKIWDILTGEHFTYRLEIVEPPYRSSNLTDFRWSPDGQYVLGWLQPSSVVDSDQTRLHIWNIFSAEPVFSLSPGETLVDASWSPNSRYLLLTTMQGSSVGRNTHRIYDIQTGRLLIERHDRLDYSFNLGAWSPDGSKIVIVGSVTLQPPEAYEIWDVQENRMLYTIPPEGNLNWGPADTFATYRPFNDNPITTVRVRDAATGELRTQFDVSMWDRNTDLVWSPDGTQFAVDSREPSHAITVWDSNTGQLRFTFPPWDSERIREVNRGGLIGPSEAVWSPDGTQLGVSTRLSRLWNMERGTVQAELNVIEAGQPYAATGFVWSPDQRFLLTHLGRATIAIWDTETGEMIYRLPFTSFQSIHEKRWSNDGRFIYLLIHDDRLGPNKAEFRSIYVEDLLLAAPSLEQIAAARAETTAEVMLDGVPVTCPNVILDITDSQPTVSSPGTIPVPEHLEAYLTAASFTDCIYVSGDKGNQVLGYAMGGHQLYIIDHASNLRLLGDSETRLVLNGSLIEGELTRTATPNTYELALDGNTFNLELRGSDAVLYQVGFDDERILLVNFGDGDWGISFPMIAAPANW